MPQPTQHSLIHVLLLWTTILSIVQAVFIILFFTTGPRDLSQNSSALAGERTPPSKANNTSSTPPPDNKLFLGEGQMLTYKATTENHVLKWETRQPDNTLALEHGKDIEIKKDGYYFLCLQVTLKTSQCLSKKALQDTVTLTWGNSVLLKGWINPDTCSTGLLGKAMLLSVGGRLKFTINQTIESDVDQTESLTHLDIIYMSKL